MAKKRRLRREGHVFFRTFIIFMSLFPSSRMTISDSRPWFIRNVFVCLVLVINLVYTVYFMEIRFSEDQHERVLTHYERVKN